MNLENLNFRHFWQSSCFVEIFNHRVSNQSTIGNFRNILLSPKMAAILNFSVIA